MDSCKEQFQMNFLLDVLDVFPRLPTDEQFFAECVRHLVCLYRADYAMIGTFAASDPEVIESRAVCTSGGPGEPLRRRLADMPWQDVLNRRLEIIPERAAQRYPDDPLLAEPGMESCLAATLDDSLGYTHGIVVVMSKSPLQVDDWLVPVLKLYAYRAALHLEQLQAQQALRRTEAEYRTLFENLAVGIYRSAPDGRQLWANPALVRLNRYSSEAELLDRVKDIATEWYVQPERRDEFKRLMETQGRVSNFVSEVYRHATRERIWVSENAHCVLDEQGAVLCYEGTVQEITARKRAEDALRASEARFRALIENAHGMILILERDGTIRYISPGIERVLGYSPRDWLGCPFFELLHPDDRQAAYDEYQRILTHHNSGQESEYRLRHSNGSWPMIALLGSNCLDNPSIAGVVVNARDVSERHEAEQQIRQLAHNDGLTGLSNRILLETRVEMAIAQARRERYAVGLLFIDLDRFKPINDTLGHAIGDALLQAIGDRLKTTVRDSDTVARLGGDEFAVLMPKIEDECDAVTLAGKLLDQLALPFRVDHHLLSVSASVGVSCYPRDADEFETLLKHADIAMYQAKSDGRDKVRCFSAAMHDQAVTRLRLAHQLHEAIHNSEFELYFQPQVDLRDGGLTGIEALLRWQHPEHGLLLPEQFVPLAEETGTAIHLGRWVLESACRQLRDWVGLLPSPPRLAVNLSARQLRDPELRDWLKQRFDEYGIEPQWLEIEIDEDALAQDLPRIGPLLEQLQTLGLSVAINHFGTGGCALEVINRLPISGLKIDRSFVAGLPGDRGDVAILRALVVLAANLDLRLVAVGVTSREQVRFLRDEGCVEIQGNPFGPAMPAEQLVAWIEAPPVARFS